MVSEDAKTYTYEEMLAKLEETAKHTYEEALAKLEETAGYTYAEAMAKLRADAKHTCEEVLAKLLASWRKSSGPNTQNISESRNAEYSQLLGETQSHHPAEISHISTSYAKLDGPTEIRYEKLTPAPEFVHLELAPEVPSATEDLAAFEKLVKQKTEETVAAGKVMCDALQKWFDANPSRKRAPDLSVFGVLSAAMYARAWREGHTDLEKVNQVANYTIAVDVVAKQAWELLCSRVLAALEVHGERTATVQETKPATAVDYDAWAKQFAAYSDFPESRQIEYPIDLTISRAEIISDSTAPTAGIEPTTGSVIVACEKTPDRYALARDWLANNFEKEAKELQAERQAEQQKIRDDLTASAPESIEVGPYLLTPTEFELTEMLVITEDGEAKIVPINAATAGLCDTPVEDKLIALSKCLGGLNPHVEMDLPLPADDDVDTPVIVKK